MHIRNRRLNKKLNWKRRKNFCEPASSEREEKTLHNLYITVLSCSLKYHSWRNRGRKNTCTAVRVDFYVLHHLTLHIHTHWCCSPPSVDFFRLSTAKASSAFDLSFCFLPRSGECVFRFTLFLFPHFLLEASFFSAWSPFGPSVHPHLLRPLFCLYFFFFLFFLPLFLPFCALFLLASSPVSYFYLSSALSSLVNSSPLSRSKLTRVCLLSYSGSIVLWFSGPTWDDKYYPSNGLEEEKNAQFVS